MKIIKIISMLLFTLILVGCNEYNMTNAVIIKKVQDEAKKIEKSAGYTFRCRLSSGYTEDITLILSETFGNVGDIISSSNGIMYTVPKIKLEN